MNKEKTWNPLGERMRSNVNSRQSSEEKDKM